jgi:hypothetical protein
MPWAGCFDDARRRGSEDIAQQIGGRESSPVSMTLANLTGQTINAKASFRTRENRRKEKETLANNSVVLQTLIFSR